MNDASGNITVGNNITVTGTLTGSTGVMNIGSGQLYKDASGNVGIGNTASNVNDQVGSIRPLLVSGSDSATTIAGSVAAVVIGNSNTTTSNTSQLSFAAITGASTTYYSSAAINCIFGARTNGQYPTGQLVFSTSTSLNSAPTEKARIDAAGNWYMNSGYGSSAVAYGCRAWVSYNGTSTPAIRGSANVSSVTRSAAGLYIANLTTAMTDTNYAMCVTGGCYFGVLGGYFGEYTTSSTSPNQRSTSAVPVFFQAGATNAGQDNPTVSISVFR